MSSRAVNLSLLVFLTLEFVSGLSSYLVGTPDGRWLFWAHRVAGFAIVALLGWKLGIVVRSYRKRGLSASTLISALLGGLFLAALAFGLLWSTTGVRGARMPFLGSLTGLGVHVTLAFALLPLLVFHAIVRWPKVRPRRVDLAGRRAALRYLALSAAGLAAWRASEAASALAGWSGAERRFTGSREVGSFGGNRFPATNWLTDPTPRISPEEWRLRVHGEVEAERLLTLDDLSKCPAVSTTVVLDCTGGWYTEQVWSGVRLSELLAAVGTTGAARSVVVHSRTGYRRRFALDEVEGLLLATRVSEEPLSRGHGYPVRLVAPGGRGYEWVKWVTAIEVSDLPAWAQSPLPLR